jgi:CubicO group peptidase (beta-lactamase class C family)
VGVQVAAYLHGELVVDEVAGVADSQTGAPVDHETLFNVFSVTKAVTATALHLQAQRGLVDFDRPVADYWPEYAINGKGATTVRDLMTHRSGAPQMPEGMDVEMLCDWDRMVEALAQETPIFEPGTTNAYHSISWGWLVGEIVRRTDASGRSFGTFVREELCEPLGVEDFHIGLPSSEHHRVARLIDESGRAPGRSEQSQQLQRRTMPPAAYPGPDVFGRPEVREAEIPGAGGITNARSCARLFALLAGGGRLDGFDLLDETLLRSFLVPRPDAAETDIVSGVPRYVGLGGYYLGGDSPPAQPLYGPSRGVLGHPGAGGSEGWADLDSGLAVSITHNRMFNLYTIPDGQNPFAPLAAHLRELAAPSR